MSFFSRFFDSILEWFQNLFWKQEMELTLVGLQNSGKTTLVDVIAVRLANTLERCGWIISKYMTSAALVRALDPVATITNNDQWSMVDWLVDGSTRFFPLAHVVGPIHRGYDPDRGLQHEEGHARQRHNQAVGHWRPASLPKHVGALLQRRQLHRVRLELCRTSLPGINTHLVELVASLYSFVVDAADHEKFDTARKEVRTHIPSISIIHSFVHSSPTHTHTHTHDVCIVRFFSRANRLYIIYSAMPSCTICCRSRRWRAFRCSFLPTRTICPRPSAPMRSSSDCTYL